MNYFSYCLSYRLNHRPFKLLYRGLVPKPLRNRINAHSTHEQQQRTAAGWDAFLADWFAGKMPHFDLPCKQPELPDGKTVWLYWNSGWQPENLPEVVKMCVQSVRRHCRGRRIVFLDDRTLTEYLNLPEFVWEKKNGNPEYKPAFFADLLRLALLTLYGGVWLDATVFLTDTLPEEFAKPDYFMFQRSPQAEQQEMWHAFNSGCFSWSPSHHINVQNNIIFAKPHAQLISTCLQVLLNFWRTQNRIPHYFFFQILYDRLVSQHLPHLRCPIVDDTLPHLMQLHFNRPFSQTLFDQITQRTSLHKLDRRLSINAGTLGSYLCSLNN